MLYITLPLGSAGDARKLTWKVSECALSLLSPSSRVFLASQLLIGLLVQFNVHACSMLYHHVTMSAVIFYSKHTGLTSTQPADAYIRSLHTNHE